MRKIALFLLIALLMFSLVACEKTEKDDATTAESKTGGETDSTTLADELEPSDGTSGTPDADTSAPDADTSVPDEDTSAPDANTTAPSSGECVHVMSEATCTQPARCTLCNRPSGNSLGHAWANGNCTRCGKDDPLAEKEEGVVRVVCIGDSITKGGYWKDGFGGNLGEEYEVIGLGVNGATGLAAGLDQGKPWAYTLHGEYETSLRYNPDVVVIMLGTNDSKGPNYQQITADGGAQYKADLLALIESYQALSAEPQILLALPPTVYREWTATGINNEALEEGIIPILLEIAEELSLPVIDTHTATADMKEAFPDGVHPSDDGKAVIAQTVADAIKALDAGNEVGDLCIDATLALLDQDKTGFADSMRVSDTKGKITILNFWYTSCTPCINEMPHFAEIAETYAADVAVIACHADMGHQVEAVRYINQNWSDYQIQFAYDTNDEYYYALGGLGAYPMTLVLDRDNVIVAKYMSSVTYDEIAAQIETLLGDVAEGAE